MGLERGDLPQLSPVYRESGGALMGHLSLREITPSRTLSGYLACLAGQTWLHGQISQLDGVEKDDESLSFLSFPFLIYVVHF